MKLINLLQFLCGLCAMMCAFCLYAVNTTGVQPDVAQPFTFLFAVMILFMFTLIWDERRRLKQDISYCKVANRICDACLTKCKAKGHQCPPSELDAYDEEWERECRQGR